jgi:N-acetylmuramic acid 6-phosphate etherase
MLKTEMRNPATTHIDKMSSAEMVQVMNQENLNAAMAVSRVSAEIAEAIDRIYLRMQRGGRLFYVGCGTSGRLL